MVYDGTWERDVAPVVRVCWCVVMMRCQSALPPPSSSLLFPHLTSTHFTPPSPSHHIPPFPSPQVLHQVFKKAGGGTVPQQMLPLYARDPTAEDAKAAKDLEELRADVLAWRAAEAVAAAEGATGADLGAFWG